MNITFINSKKSKTSDPHRLLLNFTDYISLRRKDKYIGLSNISIYYTLENVKRLYKNNKFKYQLQHRMKNLNYVTDHVIYQIFKVILKIC